MNILTLSLQSAWNRKSNLILSILSIAISITLLLSVDITRKQTKQSFMNTVSQTDLIVGARSGPSHLLLYSIFHLGNATNNMRYQSYQAIKNNPKVAWAIPISLGDSHKGYRVIGTEQSFYQHFRYGEQQRLQLAKGKAFNQLYDVVLGAEVARELGYRLGDKLILTHGTHAKANAQHDDSPFSVSGILKPTGTPIDRSLQVSLKAIEAIHVGWQGGRSLPLGLGAQLKRKASLQPKEVTAVLVGLKNPLYTFKVQRQLNQWKTEPLTAILPGATLVQLWKSLAFFEKVLLAVSAMVLLASFIGILITLLSSLNERRREIAILRALGIHVSQVFLLFALETLFILIAGILLGIALMFGLFALLAPVLLNLYGMVIEIPLLDLQQLSFLGLVLMVGLFLSLIPGYLAYKKSLQDGLSQTQP